MGTLLGTIVNTSGGNAVRTRATAGLPYSVRQAIRVEGPARQTRRNDRWPDIKES
jgi:hypothetical protein